MLARDNFRFSRGGTAAACIAGDDQGGLHLEAWSFVGPSVCWQLLPLTQAVTMRMHPMSLDDGRVLLCREVSADAHDDGQRTRKDVLEIVLVDRHGSTVRERILGVIGGVGLVGWRLLPGPGVGAVRQPKGTRPTSLAVAISVENRGGLTMSTIWWLADDPPHLERLVDLPGVLSGGVWLDRSGMFLGVDRGEGDGPTKAMAVDLRDGSCIPLLTVSKKSNDRLLGCEPCSGLLLVSTDAPGEERLGWAKLGSDQPVCFPNALHRPGEDAPYPLTFDPEGQRVLLRVDEGVRSRLTVYTPTTDHLAPVAIPAGIVHGAASWTSALLRFPFSTPRQPPGVATTGLPRAPSWSVVGSAPAVAGARWADAHIEWLDGAAGPIEAIIYGGEGWRTSRHLLVALHGGPVDAWRFEFDPLFQLLAAAGIAVVAPNPRGSSGYGARHLLAIRGAWGGPDLSDVCCIARALTAQRHALGAPPLRLFGVSYGAFLALLAASCEPILWSHCVAVAPFLSGPRLYQEASFTVQGLIDGMGGLQELHDDVGPRDVLRLCHAIEAKLLIVHGERDEQIPVTQSRVLRQRLLELGRREGVAFSYLEVPGGQHDLTTGAHGRAFHERMVQFLAAGTFNPIRTADGRAPCGSVSKTMERR